LTLLERAREAAEAEDYAAAAAAYEEYLSGAPEGPEAEAARFRLADLYYLKLKQLERARDHYVAFLARYPDSEYERDARRHLAEVNVDLANPTEAIAQYEQLAQEASDAEANREIRLAVADLYSELEDFSQAEIEYQKVVEGAGYDEMTERALLRLASIYHRVWSANERALPLYEQVAGATQDAVVRRQALYGLSEAFVELYRFDEAIAVLGRIDDPAEADYVAKRTAELERRKREHANTPPEVDWGKGKGES
jgi:TolA-binding protein